MIAQPDTSVPVWKLSAADRKTLLWLTGLEIFFIYTGMVLKIGSLPGFPFFFATATAVCIYAIVGRSIPRSVVRFFGIVTAFFVAEFVVTYERGISPIEQLKLLLVYLLAFPSVIMLFYAFIATGYDRIRQFCGGIVVAMIVIGFCEVHLGMRPLMEAIIRIYQPTGWLYHATVRDMITYGAIRPLVFAHEPSYVGLYSGTLAMFYMLLRPMWRPPVVHLALAVALFAADVFVVRSPTTVYFLFAGLAGFVYFEIVSPANRISPSTRKLLKYALLGLLTLSALVIIAAPFVLYIAKPLLHNYAIRNYVSTSSFFLRLIGPGLIAAKTLLAVPLTGVGIAGEARLFHIEEPILILIGRVEATSSATVNYASHYITNGFWEYFVYYGVGIGLLNLILLGGLFKRLGVRDRYLLVAMTVIMWQSTTGLNQPFPWLPVFCLGAVMRMRRSAEATIKKRFLAPPGGHGSLAASTNLSQ